MGGHWAVKSTANRLGVPTAEAGDSDESGATAEVLKPDENLLAKATPCSKVARVDVLTADNACSSRVWRSL